MTQSLESEISRTIRDYLELHGCLMVRVNSGAIMLGDPDTGKKRMYRGAEKGTSDLLGCLPGGKFLAVEVKRPGKKPTDAQREFLGRVIDAGGIGIVATSIEDVEGLFE